MPVRHVLYATLGSTPLRAGASHFAPYPDPHPQQALDSGVITRAHFDNLIVAINTGTNLPSVATPNGQAAFLFLLTSALAPLLRLSYIRMMMLALPYTIVLTIMGLIGCTYFL